MAGSDTAKANSSKSASSIYVLRSNPKQGTHTVLFAARNKSFSIPAPWKTSRGEKRSINRENTYDDGIYPFQYFHRLKK
jgi:hypothetical protein